MLRVYAASGVILFEVYGGHFEDADASCLMQSVSSLQDHSILLEYMNIFRS